MVSRTKVKLRRKKKTNPEVSETLSLALKNTAWEKIATLVSGPARKYSSVNLDQIDKETKLADTVVIVGKVLSKGTLSKKVRICALSFSEAALEKIKESKSEAVSIADEIKKNPKYQGVKLIK